MLAVCILSTTPTLVVCIVHRRPDSSDYESYDSYARIPYRILLSHRTTTLVVLLLASSSMHRRIVSLLVCDMERQTPKATRELLLKPLFDSSDSCAKSEIIVPNQILAISSRYCIYIF